MSNPKDKRGFNLQRKKGTAGGEKLTEVEQNAKEEVDSYLSECSSYTEVRERLRKMPTTDDIESGQQKKQEDASTTEEPVSNSDLRRFMDLVCQKISSLEEKANRDEEQKEKKQASTQKVPNQTSWGGPGYGEFEDEADYEYDAAYNTSDEEDANLVREDPEGLLERYHCRKLCTAAQEATKEKRTALPEHKKPSAM